MYSNCTSQEVRHALAHLSPPSVVDIKPRHRRIPLSRAKHVRGWHPVRPGHGAVGFESKLESRFLTFIAQAASELTAQSQPITITYLIDGRRRRYTPDFLIHLPHVPELLSPWGFGLQTYMEIKPLGRVLALGSAWLMRMAALRALGTNVALVTDEDLAQVAAKEIA